MADPIHAFEADGTPSPGAKAALDGKADTGHTHAWADLTDPPATFPPAQHQHALADVDGLQDAIDDTGWVDLSLAAGFSHYGEPGPTAQVRRIGPVVHLRGRLTRADGDFITGTGYVVLTLPSEFRPSFNGRYVLGGGTTTQWGRAEVVAASGEVGFAAISGDLVWIDLGGMNWTID